MRRLEDFESHILCPGISDFRLHQPVVAKKNQPAMCFRLEKSIAQDLVDHRSHMGILQVVATPHVPDQRCSSLFVQTRIPNSGVQAGVQTAVARSGKGAVQGAAQACCEAAESGRGAVLSRVLYRLWLAAVRSGGKVWETCCAACCRLARSGKGYAAGCWLREGTVHRNFQRCCRGTKSGMVVCCAGCCPEKSGKGAVQGAVQAAGQSVVARGTVQGCWVQGAGQCGGELWKGLLCRLLPRSAVARFGKGAVHAAIQGAVEALSAGYCAGCCPQCTVQAAVHSAKPLHCKGLCWARLTYI